MTTNMIIRHAHRSPEHVLSSIPSSLTLKPATPWWTNSDDQEFRHGLSSAEKKIFGIDEGHAPSFLQRLQSYEHMHATDAFHVTNGMSQLSALPDVPPSYIDS